MVQSLRFGRKRLEARVLTGTGFLLSSVSIVLGFGVPVIQRDLQTGSGFLTNYLTSLNLSFSACKMGTLIFALLRQWAGRGSSARAFAEVL